MPSDPFHIATIDEAREAFAEAIGDASGDYPDVNPDDVAHDMLQSVALRCTPSVAQELCRMELGWIPIWCPR